MKIKFIFISILVCTTFFANAQVKYKTAPTGLKYAMFTTNKGEKPKIGDVIKFHFILKTDKDSVIMSSYKSGNPPETRIAKPSYSGDLMDGFMMMAKGDSAIFLVSADSFYGGQQIAPNLKGSMLNIMIKLLEVTPSAEFEEKMKKAQDEQAKVAAANKDKEPELLAKYIKEKAPNAIKTSSGLYYVIEQEGTGPTPQPGQTVYAHYTGTLLNGKEFDSDHGNPFSFKIGQHQVIAGWDEGFALFKKGTKAKLIIPSALAYGAQGAGGVIAGYSPLVFEVELVDIK